MSDDQAPPAEAPAPNETSQIPVSDGLAGAPDEPVFATEPVPVLSGELHPQKLKSIAKAMKRFNFFISTPLIKTNKYR